MPINKSNPFSFYIFHINWFVVACLCITLFIWQLRNFDYLNNFWTNNNLIAAKMSSPLAYIGDTAAVISFCYIIGLVWSMKTKFFYFKLINRLTTFFKITPWLIFTPIFFEKNLWRTNPFLPLTVLIFYAFFLARFLCLVNPNLWAKLAKLMPSGQSLVYEILLFLSVISYTLYFSFYTIINHLKFHTYAYDLGRFQNLTLHALQGHFLKAYHGGTHLSVIHYLWVPFYALLPRSETLLFMQSFVIALGAIPLFFLAKKLLHTKKISLLISLLYLINPAQHSANFYDVHELHFLPLLFFLLIYCHLKERSALYYFFLLLCLGIKEDMVFLVLFVSTFLFLEKKSLVRYLVTVSLCITWFLYTEIYLRKMLLIPNFGFYYSDLIPSNSSGPLAVIKLIFADWVYVFKYIAKSDRILYFLQLTLPFAFLPLVRARNLLLVLYGFSITLLSTNKGLYMISFQYVWCILPFLFIGLIYSLREIILKVRWVKIHHRKNIFGASFINKYVNLPYSLVVTVCFLSFVFSYQYGAVFNRTFFVGGWYPIDFTYKEEDRNRLKAFEELVSLIPEHSSITASEVICPHLERFADVSTFRYYPNDTDYLFLTNPVYENLSLFNDLLTQRKYTLLKDNHYFQLWINSKLAKS